MVIETHKGAPNAMSAAAAGIVAWTVSSIGAFSCEEAEENAVLATRSTKINPLVGIRTTHLRTTTNPGSGETVRDVAFRLVFAVLGEFTARPF